MDDLTILGFRRYDTNLPRAPVARDMGPSVKGVLLPHGDPGCPFTRRDGVIKRMGQPLPKPFPKDFLKLVTQEVNIFIKERKLTPIPKDGLISPLEWLERTNYPEWRKQELRDYYHNEIRDFKDRDWMGRLKHFLIKSFMKDEHYVDWKHVRDIYARSDGAKLQFGGAFKMMEDQVYKQPEFIKHVPVRDRANYIYDFLFGESYVYVATDFSAFESHFTAEMMRACEFVLYGFMLQNYPDLFHLMEEVLQGTNNIQDKWFGMKVDARRMSGEMNTSLGNGFSNLIFMRTISRMYGYGEAVGVVEGDDGLFRYKRGKSPTTENFTDNGFNIKLDLHDKICYASFCGLLFDEDCRDIVTDPRKVLALFGWTSAKYSSANQKTIKKLIRCKALSLAHAYPACPIVSELARYGLRATRSYNVTQFINARRDLNLYEREKFLEADTYFKQNRDELSIPRKEVGMGSRLLVEGLFDIPVDEQLRIEEMLRNKDDLSQITIPTADVFMPNSWIEYADRYILDREDDRKFDFSTIAYRNYLV